MKTFHFLAKQGQADQVCRILFNEFKVKPRVSLKNGFPKISIDLPEGVSKRTVDRLLYSNNVPGARSRRNKYPVIAGEQFDILANNKHNFMPFNWVLNGRFMGVVIAKNQCSCDCCGPWYQLVPFKKSQNEVYGIDHRKKPM